MAIPHGSALALHDLIVPTPDGIASRVLAKEAGGSLTLFAFPAGRSLAEHASPLEAIALVLEGTFVLTVGGERLDAVAGAIVRLPAGVPHGVSASTAGRMLLVTLKPQT